MMNGLGEIDPSLYDGLAEALLKDKPDNAAILFPITSHFVRRTNFPSSENDPYKIKGDRPNEAWIISHEIIDRIPQEPSNLIDGFKQMMKDINDLVDNITRSPRMEESELMKFSKDFFHENVKLSLLGYSMGGLNVISAMLEDSPHYRIMDKKRIEKIFSTFILNESGASLASTKAGILFRRNDDDIRKILEKLDKPEDLNKNQLFIEGATFDKRKQSAWKGILEKLQIGEINWNDIKNDRDFHMKFVRDIYSGDHLCEWIIDELFKEMKNKHNLTETEKEIFEMIVLGDHQHQSKYLLSQNVIRLLILLGGIDEIFNPTLYHSFAPAKTGLAIFQIPELGHWLKFRDNKKWKKWQLFITEIINDFRLLKP